MSIRRFTRRITRNGNSLTVSLPHPIVTALGFSRGDELVVSVVGDSVLLTSLEQRIDERVREAATRVALDQAAAVKA